MTNYIMLRMLIAWSLSEFTSQANPSSRTSEGVAFMLWVSTRGSKPMIEPNPQTGRILAKSSLKVRHQMWGRMKYVCARVCLAMPTVNQKPTRHSEVNPFQVSMVTSEVPPLRFPPPKPWMLTTNCEFAFDGE